MKMQRCPKGHYYDADKYDSCPSCKNDENQTQGFDPNGGNGDGDDRTVGSLKVEKEHDKQKGRMEEDDATQASFVSINYGSDAKNKGVAFDTDENPITRPVVGWLVCVEGSNIGQSFNLYPGRNFIGRSDEMDISLKGDREISRDKHAIVIYDPRHRKYYAEAGEAHSLFYVNDEMVTRSILLKDRDILELGKNKLVFVAFCNDSFSWE